jgi:hypothetical protein
LAMRRGIGRSVHGAVGSAARILPNLRDEFGCDVCRGKLWSHLLPN